MFCLLKLKTKNILCKWKWISLQRRQTTTFTDSERPSLYIESNALNLSYITIVQWIHHARKKVYKVSKDFPNNIDILPSITTCRRYAHLNPIVFIIANLCPSSRAPVFQLPWKMKQPARYSVSSWFDRIPTQQGTWLWASFPCYTVELASDNAEQCGIRVHNVAFLTPEGHFWKHQTQSFDGSSESLQHANCIICHDTHVAHMLRSTSQDGVPVWSPESWL